MIPERAQRRAKFLGSAVTTFTLVMRLCSSTAQTQRVRSAEDTARILAIEKIAVRAGMISGEVHNKFGHAVRDVQLLIRYIWLWDDELNPGKVDPDTPTYFTLNQTIDPGVKIGFDYKPSPPLPKIAGGRFETTVTIAGFTEIIPQKSGAPR